MVEVAEVIPADPRREERLLDRVAGALAVDRQLPPDMPHQGVAQRAGGLAQGPVDRLGAGGRERLGSLAHKRREGETMPPWAPRGDGQEAGMRAGHEGSSPHARLHRLHAREGPKVTVLRERL